MRIRLQTGISTLEVVLLLVIVGLLGFTGWYIYDANHVAQTTYNKLAAHTGTPGKTAIKTILETDDGKTIAVKTGQKFDVQLDSTYWSFDPPSPSDFLQTLGSVTVVPKSIKNTVPGSGAGTVTAHFMARTAGTVTITAHRTSCGEALGCTGSAGSFSVTIEVQ